MLGFEAHKVAESDGLAVFVLDDEPHLTVGIDVVARGGDIVVQGVTRIGHVGCTHIPQAGVVLYAIEQVKVLGLNGTQTDKGKLIHCSLS